MRHGESSNNIAQHNAYEGGLSYQKARTFEPEISETGVKCCKAMGQQLKTLGMEFSKIYCSA